MKRLDMRQQFNLEFTPHLQTGGLSTLNLEL
jgi:hypothetical protein